MTEFLKKEFKRLVDLLPQTDPRGMEYQTLLRSIECLDAIGLSTIDVIVDMDKLEAAAEKSKVVPFTKAEFPEAVEETVEEKAEAVEETGAEETGANEPKPEPAPVESVVEEKTYTSAEVRKALVEARGKGVDVKAVLAKVGADNFTAVPASKYAALMDALNGAN